MSADNLKPLIQFVDLSVSFPARSAEDPKQSIARTQAADQVNLSVFAGQTLAVVGESGSGKSVSALSALQLIPTPPGRYDGGKILWRSDLDNDPVNLLALNQKQMRSVRGDQIAMIFQEPMTSLNPVYTLGEQIVEAIFLHRKVNREQAIQIAAKAMDDVGIADPKSRLSEYPHQLSGGMRQRIMIAMALACQPRLLLADEPTTALDVTIQAQILELLRSLQQQKQMAVILITHDLGVVAENADTVAVMFAGRIVEYARVEDIFENPLHPYTRGLLKSMPVLGQKADRLPTVMDGATIPDHFPGDFSVKEHTPDLPPGQRYGGDYARLHEVLPGHWVLTQAVLDTSESTATAPMLDYRRAASCDASVC